MNNELICMYYPDDSCDKQCLTKFKQDEVMLLTTSNDSSTNICPVHNQEYGYIENNTMYCDECTYSSLAYSIDDWKEYTLIEMENFKQKLNNKINGLNNVIEMIKYNNNSLSDIKQIEDIVDSTFVDISHIDNFCQFIDNVNIKRKNTILNSNIIIQIPSLSNNQLTEYIQIILKDYEANIHTQNDYALRCASANGHLSSVECLIKHGANIHACNDSALCSASKNGHLEVVKLLVKYGADVHACNNCSLQYASEYGHLDVVKFLIYNGSNIHANDDWALRWASHNGHLDIVEYLISHGADIHASNNCAFKSANDNNHMDVVECLIKQYIIKKKVLKSSWNTTNDEYMFCFASMNGRLDVVELLIEHSINIHAYNDRALCNASSNGHIDIVELLIKHGAYVYAQNNAALRYASLNGHLDIVDLLIKHGADQANLMRLNN